jgi:Mat/Ecp fimbriae outer membrane usher protein
LCISVLPVAPVQVRAQTAIKVSAAPKGFETLTEPQTTLVDVFYAGRAVVSTLATFTADSLTLANPLEVVSNIPKVKNADEIVKSLTGELSSNTDLVCPEITQKVTAEIRKALLADCGRMNPKVAGFIFDESKFRLDIHIHPDYLDTTELGLTRYLPASNADESLVTSFSGSMSGTDETKNDYSLNNVSILGLGEGRIRLNSSYTSSDQWIMDTLTGEMDRDGDRFLVGAMRSRSMDNVSSFKMLGGRYTTTTDTRIDLDVGFGSQLVVFLPRDAQVDLIRDGRLISTKFYEAGKTTLDTSQMPDGAYDVTIRIKEAGGVTRDETQFYVKTATLPPADHPLYFLEGGILLSENSPPYPELNHVGLIHGGAMWRLTENLGAGGDLLAGENLVVAEAKALYLGRELKLNLAGIVSSDLDLGLSIGANGDLWDMTYSTSLRRNWAQEKSSTTATFDPIGRSFTQARASLNYLLGSAQWSLQGLTQTNDDADDTWSIGPAVTYPFLRTQTWGALLRAEATRSESETVATARIQIRFNEPRWSASTSAAITSNNSETSASTANEGIVGDGTLNTAWHDLDYLPGDLTLGAGLSAKARTRSLSGKVDYASRWGKYSFDASNDWGGATRSTRWGGNLISSVITDGEVVAFGGRERQESGIVVALDGASPDAEFNVMVNGSNKGAVRVGDRLPVLLSPYKTYKVRLEQLGGEFISFDSENRDITLYPGNIVGIAWSINPIVAVFGRIVRQDGTPLSFAKVDGVGRGTFTDDLGYFQAEMSKPGTFRISPPEGEACEIEIASLPEKQVYVDLKDIVCRTVLLEARNESDDEKTEAASTASTEEEKKVDWSPVIAALKQNLEPKKTKGSDSKPAASVAAKSKSEDRTTTQEAPVNQQQVAAVADPENTVSEPGSAPTPEDTPKKVEANDLPSTETADLPAPVIEPEDQNIQVASTEAGPGPDDTAVPEQPDTSIETGPKVVAQPVPAVAAVKPATLPQLKEAKPGKPKNLIAAALSETPTTVEAIPAFRVQLAAFRRPDRLGIAWQQMSQKASGRLDGMPAYMARAELGDQGTFFRLQAGDVPNRQAAAALCDDLTTAGLNCRVVKAAEVQVDNEAGFCLVAGSSTGVPSCPSELIETALTEDSAAGSASGVSTSSAAATATATTPERELDIEAPAWRVQLGSFLTAQDAQDDWVRVEKLSEGFLTGLEPEVREVDLKRRGIWHRLHVRVPEGRIAARSLCDNLADLSISCLIVNR